jgi:hypothetical protein
LLHDSTARIENLSLYKCMYYVLCIDFSLLLYRKEEETIVIREQMSLPLFFFFKFVFVRSYHVGIIGSRAAAAAAAAVVTTARSRGSSCTVLYLINSLVMPYNDGS